MNALPVLALAGPLQVSVLVVWVAVALVALFVVKIIRDEHRKDRVLCLLYHRVVTDAVFATFKERERIFSVSETSFRDQMDWLKERGYQFVNMEDVVEPLRNKTPLPKNAVFISFDDGCESVFSRALPILQEREIPSTVFVTTDPETWIFHSGEYHERRMTPEELRACEAGGILVESHAVTHRGLNEMSDEQALKEMVDSKAEITAWIGRAVRYFSIPLNFYNKRTLELCAEAGYDGTCVCDGATTNGGLGHHNVRRFIVEGAWNIKQFEHSLKPKTVSQRRLVSLLKRMPPKILGEKRWMPLRAWIFRTRLGKHLTFPVLRKAVLLLALCFLASWSFLTAYAFNWL